MTAPWLTQMLLDKGVMSQAGLTRNAAIRTHKPCRTPCLAGIDDIGYDTWCDLGELTPTGEVNALLEDRRTFDLHAQRLLCRRFASRIAYAPAGRDTGRPVFAEHRCDAPIPDAWRQPPPPRTPTPPRSEGIGF